jgi:hypothetical protein
MSPTPSDQFNDGSVVNASIGFWTTVAEREKELIIEAEELAMIQQAPSIVCRRYCEGALPQIMPLLLAHMNRSEGDGNEDTLLDNPDSPIITASECITALSVCCQDVILTHTQRYMIDSMQQTDWKARNGAMHVFGCIIEGCTEQGLSSAASELVPFLLHSFQDPMLVVRDTASWVLGRIAEYLPSAILYPNMPIDAVINPTVSGVLQGRPSMAVNCAWFLESVNTAAIDMATELAGDTDVASFRLSPMFASIVEALWTSSLRSDGDQHELASTCLHTITTLCETAPTDCKPVVQSLFPVVLQRLESVVIAAGSGMHQASVQILEADLCGCLQVCMLTLTHTFSVLLSISRRLFLSIVPSLYCCRFLVHCFCRFLVLVSVDFSSTVSVDRSFTVLLSISRRLFLSIFGCLCFCRSLYAFCRLLTRNRDASRIWRNPTQRVSETLS